MKPWIGVDKANEAHFIEQRYWSRGAEDASYPCPDHECRGVVTLEGGYWQCDECSFRSLHVTKKE